MDVSVAGLGDGGFEVCDGGSDGGELGGKGEGELGEVEVLEHFELLWCNERVVFVLNEL